MNLIKFYEKKDIEALLKNTIPEGKFIKQTYEVTAEYMRLFTLGLYFFILRKEFISSSFTEAINRAIKQAKLDNENEVKPIHLQKILPQLLLDF